MDEGARRGWCLLTKDQAIRRRDDEAAAVGATLLFTLSSQQLTAAEMVDIIDAQRHRIEQRIRKGVPGIYVVSRGSVSSGVSRK